MKTISANDVFPFYTIRQGNMAVNNNNNNNNRSRWRPKYSPVSSMKKKSLIITLSLPLPDNKLCFTLRWNPG